MLGPASPRSLFNIWEARGREERAGRHPRLLLTPTAAVGPSEALLPSGAAAGRWSQSGCSPASYISHLPAWQLGGQWPPSGRCPLPGAGHAWQAGPAMRLCVAFIYSILWLSRSFIFKTLVDPLCAWQCPRYQRDSRKQDR